MKTAILAVATGVFLQVVTLLAATNDLPNTSSPGAYVVNAEDAVFFFLKDGAVDAMDKLQRGTEIQIDSIGGSGICYFTCKGKPAFIERHFITAREAYLAAQERARIQAEEVKKQENEKQRAIEQQQRAIEQQLEQDRKKQAALEEQQRQEQAERMAKQEQRARAEAEQQARKKEEQARYEAEQRARGLIQYQGSWMTPEQAHAAALDSKAGFREFRLGAKKSEIDPPGIELELPFGKELQGYQVTDFDHSLGNFEIDGITLYFDRVLGILKWIHVKIEGERNVLGILEALKAAYGEPKRDSFLGGPPSKSDDYEWIGSDVTLRYNTHLAASSATAEWKSQKVDKIIEDDMNRRSKEGAPNAAKGL